MAMLTLVLAMLNAVEIQGLLSRLGSEPRPAAARAARRSPRAGAPVRPACARPRAVLAAAWRGGR